MRRFTPIELAAGASLVGTLLAIAIPSFAREVHASRFVEPVDGLARIGAGAVAYAEGIGEGHFPDSVPLTPPSTPRGRKEVDAPGAWDVPTWKALGFRPVPEGVPHAYAFSFESTSGGYAFVARAHGDLDGDGVLSTFEIRGASKPGEPPKVVPGMYVESELE